MEAVVDRERPKLDVADVKRRALKRGSIGRK
jgi:hypothetical protein